MSEVPLSEVQQLRVEIKELQRRIEQNALSVITDRLGYLTNRMDEFEKHLEGLDESLSLVVAVSDGHGEKFEGFSTTVLHIVSTLDTLRREHDQLKIEASRRLKAGSGASATHIMQHEDALAELKALVVKMIQADDRANRTHICPTCDGSGMVPQ